MLSEELNQKMTRVGPGTPAGNLLRRYWWPVAASAELASRPTKKVRLLGEDLVLFRDASGNMGLIAERCPHRRVSLVYGIPEPDGIRCPYHGWLMDRQGNCLEQPAEPPESNFKDKVKVPAYQVQELGGLIFGYLGPEPAPLLPRYDEFVWDNAVREIGAAVIPCNWLQIMENSLDGTHVEWLHGYYGNHVRRLQAEEQGEPFKPRPVRHHKKIGFDLFDYGIVKRRIEEGGSEEDDDWKIGHALVFPCILANPTMQIRVPMDDTHTWHLWYTATKVNLPAPVQAHVPFYNIPWQTEDGEFITNFVDGQDILSWVTQGEIAERHLERLGASDAGIILYRQVLKDQIERVERDEDPLGVIRDPANNQIIELPRERVHHGERRDVQFAGDGRLRVGARPNAPEYVDAMRELRRQASEAGAELMYEPPPILVDSERTVTADLA
ncbi:MAG TPA: Rieske 2Fe-2S domain-containing protein [Chloroflexota bacterium]|nr:Rieske 2Fe-2S domain-containing protein [Chloroflexota bacterium]